MLFRRLVPLRIPSCWEVAFNNFVELGDPEALDAAAREAYLSQDLLMLRSPRYVLELGWRPDGDPAGSYRLTVVTPDWENTGIELMTRGAPVVRDAIELILHGLNAGDTPEQMQAKLVEATTLT